MVSSRVRQWFVVFLVVSFAVSAVMFFSWRTHAQFSAGRLLAAITPSAADTRTIPYRVEQLEDGVERIREQHERITWLLVVNLAGVSGSLGTYILTNRRRFFHGIEGRPQ